MSRIGVELIKIGVELRIFVVSLVLIFGTPWVDQGRSHWWGGLRKKPLMRRFKEEADEKSGWGDGNLIFQVTKIGKSFKSEGIPKFESLKNKQKFEPLKANELKFVPFKLNFPFFGKIYT